MPRYTVIATRNDCTGRFDSGESALEHVAALGLEVHTRSWTDNYTNAYGRHFAVRTRHLKKLVSAQRAFITEGT